MGEVWRARHRLLARPAAIKLIRARAAGDAPAPPSARTELPIPKAREDLVLACLEKDPGKRPQSAKELARRLSLLEGADGWTEERAREWWQAHQPA